MNSTVEKDKLLADLNTAMAKLLTPAMLYIGLLMITGLVGNAMVFFFYGWKSKRTAATTFILALAIYDFISCLASMPVEIADLRYYYLFKSVAACKMFELVNHFAAIASAFSLTAVAFDRYKRICHPFEKQLSIKHAHIVCGICGGVSVLLAWPPLIFYTVLRYDVPNTYGVELQGFDCGLTKDEDAKTFVFAYNLMLLVGFIIITFVLSVLYTLIGRQLFRHKKFRFYVAKKSLRRTVSGQTVSMSDFSSGDESVGSLTTDKPDVKSTDKVYQDPPNATGSVVDLKGFVTRGLPEVEGDRPSSGYKGVTKDTNKTGGSQKGIRRVQSITINDKSPNTDFNKHGQAKETELSSWHPGISNNDVISHENDNYPTPNTSTNSPSGVAIDKALSDEDGSTKRDIESRQPSGAIKRSRSSRGSKRSNLVVPAPHSPADSRTRSHDVMELTEVPIEMRDKPNTDASKVKDPKMKLLDTHTVKYTLIMLVITALFIISFLPHLCLIIWRWFLDEVEVHVLSDTELVWYNIGVRSFFLNSALNPLIYGFFNSKFRAFFYALCCPCCARSRKRKQLQRHDSGTSDNI